MRKNNQKILRNYVTSSGKVPFLEWLNSLKDPITRIRVRRRLDRIELGNLGDCKPVGEGVSEIRLSFGPGYRIYFAEQDNIVIILLCAGDKASQKKDIKTAKMYWLSAGSKKILHSGEYFAEQEYSASALVYQ